MEEIKLSKNISVLIPSIIERKYSSEQLEEDNKLYAIKRETIKQERDNKKSNKLEKNKFNIFQSMTSYDWIYISTIL